MSKWDLYRGEYSASKNLAIDEYLLKETTKNDNKVVRIYDFEKPSVILARNESFEDIKNIESNYEYTRRDSGGSVIFCDENALFYSVIMPNKENKFPERLHRDFFGPKIAKVLERSGVEKKKIGVGEHFSVRINGKTVSGNSQRKKKGGILYHGVLALESWDVEKLDQIIELREKEGETEYDFIEKLPGLYDHSQKSIEKEDVASYLIQEFTEGDYKKTELSGRDKKEISKLVDEKYGNQEWIKNGKLDTESLKKNQGFCFVDWTDEWKEDVIKQGFY